MTRRFLVDTQALLWWLANDARLGRRARRNIAEGEPYVSPAVLWEIAIKASLGKLQADVSEVARVVTQQSMPRLPIADAHLGVAQSLPFHHRDPFDRLLVAQAASENLPVLTSDAVFAAYAIETEDATV